MLLERLFRDEATAYSIHKALLISERRPVPKKDIYKRAEVEREKLRDRQTDRQTDRHRHMDG